MKIDLSGIASSPRKLMLALLLSALSGILWFILVRAATLTIENDHYHANFGVYINGEREMFAEPTFYEEVSSCGSEEDNPKTRVHMHDLEYEAIHVHEASSTWGNFFENIGFVLGNNVLYVRGETYVDGQGGELTFILNGESERSITNQTIKNEDVLLVSFGDEEQDSLKEQFESISLSAAEHNQEADPAACSGSDTLNYWERIQYVLGVQ